VGNYPSQKGIASLQNLGKMKYRKCRYNRIDQDRSRNEKNLAKPDEGCDWDPEYEQEYENIKKWKKHSPTLKGGKH